MEIARFCKKTVKALQKGEPTAVFVALIEHVAKRYELARGEKITSQCNELECLQSLRLHLLEVSENKNLQLHPNDLKVFCRTLEQEYFSFLVTTDSATRLLESESTSLEHSEDVSPETMIEDEVMVKMQAGR